MPPWLLAALLAAAPDAEPTIAPEAAPVEQDWCVRAHALIADAPSVGPTALTRFTEASTALFEAGSPVAARARAVVGADGDFGAAFSVLAAAAAEACAPGSDDDAALAAASVRELIARDARFAGVRRGDDLLDRLRHKVFLWLSQLLETEGMQRFAGSTRSVFFAALLVVAALLALRVVRRLRRRAALAMPAPGVNDPKRLEAFAALRAEAEQRLRERDARGALLVGARALLVRVGEQDASATRAARTHREVLAGLAPPVADAVAPALGAFERALFAEEATLERAGRFLALVDAAALSVGASTAGPAAAS
ncbi:MAG: hypothetical protein HYS27_14725 [Deltaproteobacteria bacterium]|nr:hypothetical protein [Deltaproteobacteria bacterium]